VMVPCEGALIEVFSIREFGKATAAITVRAHAKNSWRCNSPNEKACARIDEPGRN
jgi:hypothetical protein